MKLLSDLVNLFPDHGKNNRLYFPRKIINIGYQLIVEDDDFYLEIHSRENVLICSYKQEIYLSFDKIKIITREDSSKIKMFVDLVKDKSTRVYKIENYKLSYNTYDWISYLMSLNKEIFDIHDLLGNMERI